MRPADPGPYGRLVVGSDGTLERIVEAKDASASERAIGLCNAGVMAVDGRVLWELLDRVKPDNAKGEYYLTDLVGLARARGLSCGVIEADADEAVGVNSRVELAQVEGLFQARMRRQAMLGGATLTDPASVWFSHDTVLGRDVTVGPCVVFGPGVTVGDHVTIKGFCHLEGARIAAGAQVGPYARLRPGAAADLVCWPLEGVAFAGALSDPVEGLLRCGPVAARPTVVAGRPVVRDGRLVSPDVDAYLARHRAAAERLQRGAGARR